MITDEMLREAARESLEDYVNSLERDYDPAHPHQFSKEFEKKIERLKRRANHPVFYKTMQRVASVVLAILIGGGAWLTVDVEARAAFFGWVKEVYETFFVYRFSGDADMSTKTSNYEPNWIPDGYTKSLPKQSPHKFCRFSYPSQHPSDFAFRGFFLMIRSLFPILLVCVTNQLTAGSFDVITS